MNCEMSSRFGFLGAGEVCTIIIHLCAMPQLYYYNTTDPQTDDNGRTAAVL